MARPLRLQARPPRALGEPHQPQQRRELHRPPASINLTAAAADSDGSVATVEFYNGATLIGTATTTPYAIAWTNIPVGNYSLTAKATDNLGLAATSAAVGVTVEVGDASTLYFIHPDHLNSPRLITDAAGTTVWRWDNAEPFGANAPIDDPDGDGKHLTFNLRFPGQYHDAESGLSYNFHRDYDPATGRYVESDPIGLAGGGNTYAYVDGNPLILVDPFGEAPKWTAKIPVFGCFILSGMFGEAQKQWNKECPPDHIESLKYWDQFDGPGLGDKLRSCACKKLGRELCSQYYKQCVKAAAPLGGVGPKLPR